MTWCKSGLAPIHEGTYQHRGTTVTVRRSTTGRYYATRHGQYVPGLIWQLRADLDRIEQETLIQ